MNDHSRKVASAVKYERGAHAPVLIAKGYGAAADKIIALARDSDVPIVKDDGLISLLSSVDVGAFIPESCYAIVAELLTFVYNHHQRAEHE